MEDASSPTHLPRLKLKLKHASLKKLLSCNHNNNQNTNKLQIVDTISSTPSSAVYSPPSDFKLPDGWVVEKRPRARPGCFDKFYHEPGTGRIFRSLVSIQRYLNGETNAVSKSKKMKPYNDNIMQIVPCIFKSLPFNLPDGWIVEEKPRTNVNYAGKIDRYYIEPGTKKRFRSLLSVQRHLIQGQEYTSKAQTQGSQFTMSKNNTKLPGENCSMNIVIKRSTDGLTICRPLEPGNHCISSTGYRPQKEKFSGKEVESSRVDLSSSPAKIKWVLSGLDGNRWNPFIDDSKISDSTKQKWSKTFSLILSDKV